jgi:hypothetical protein
VKIGLIDVDSHSGFPNLALMKISAWHKLQGDDVEMYFPMYHYDKVYMSKVFDFTPDFETIIKADVIIQGGRAYDKKKTLPQHIETMCPDYSLYNIKNEAYGYLTRGCPRGCPFCDVVNIEGKISYKVANLSQFWNGEKEIKLLDPNLLAYKGHNELLKQLADSKASVDFTQGLDARMLTEKNIEIIKQIKIKVVHFAWDNIKDEKIIISKLKTFKDATGLEYRKLKVYVLTNYNSTHEEDLHRIYTLKNIGYDPYVMIYDKPNAPRKTRLLQRWVNNKIIFRTCDKFDDYNNNLG